MTTAETRKPMTNSERTRAIKQVLIPEFGRQNVSVHQGQGTAHEWVYVRIRLPEKAPRNSQAQLQKEADVREKVRELIAKTTIQLSQYMTDYGPASLKHPYADCLSIKVKFS